MNRDSVAVSLPVGRRRKPGLTERQLRAQTRGLTPEVVSNSEALPCEQVRNPFTTKVIHNFQRRTTISGVFLTQFAICSTLRPCHSLIQRPVSW